MAKVTGHSYKTGVLTLDGVRRDVKIATFLYSNDDINPPSLLQRARNARDPFYRATYSIPESDGGLPVVALSRDVRIYSYIGNYVLPKSLLFIPISAFRPCIDKEKGTFKLPYIYDSGKWRVENYRVVRKQVGYSQKISYETMGGVWVRQDTGKRLADFTLNGEEAAEIIKNEFYSIPHDADGKELDREWVSCFVRNDVGKMLIEFS